MWDLQQILHLIGFRFRTTQYLNIQKIELPLSFTECLLSVYKQWGQRRRRTFICGPMIWDRLSHSLPNYTLCCISPAAFLYLRQQYKLHLIMIWDLVLLADPTPRLQFCNHLMKVSFDKITVHFSNHENKKTKFQNGSLVLKRPPDENWIMDISDELHIFLPKKNVPNSCTAEEYGWSAFSNTAEYVSEKGTINCDKILINTKRWKFRYLAVDMPPSRWWPFFHHPSSSASEENMANRSYLYYVRLMITRICCKYLCHHCILHFIDDILICVSILECNSKWWLVSCQTRWNLYLYI